MWLQNFYPQRSLSCKIQKNDKIEYNSSNQFIFFYFQGTTTQKFQFKKLLGSKKTATMQCKHLKNTKKAEKNKLSVTTNFFILLAEVYCEHYLWHTIWIVWE